MTENPETTVIDMTPRKKPFFLNKKYVVAVVAAAAVTAGAYIVLKKDLLADNVDVNLVDDVLTVTQK